MSHFTIDLLDKLQGCGRFAIIAGAGMGAVLLLAVTGASCLNIAVRPFGSGIRGTLELSGYLCALGAGLCVPAAQAAGSHISAGLWADKLPKAIGLCFDLLCNLACAAAAVGIALQLKDIGEYAHDMGEYIDGFSFSYAFAAFGLAFGIVLHAGIFLYKAARLLVPQGSGR